MRVENGESPAPSRLRSSSWAPWGILGFFSTRSPGSDVLHCPLTSSSWSPPQSDRGWRRNRGYFHEQNLLLYLRHLNSKEPCRSQGTWLEGKADHRKDQSSSVPLELAGGETDGVDVEAQLFSQAYEC
ncbi:hypothetical protein VNO77_15148 [Canavalia gladiata]|uniref:Uncharacterized protein n=1 Tax=Canavalia gladiata TaxID=3824 RepID=A0AAN9QP21_CANGL